MCLNLSFGTLRTSSPGLATDRSICLAAASSSSSPSNRATLLMAPSSRTHCCRVEGRPSPLVRAPELRRARAPALWLTLGPRSPP